MESSNASMKKWVGEPSPDPCPLTHDYCRWRRSLTHRLLIIQIHKLIIIMHRIGINALSHPNIAIRVSMPKTYKMVTNNCKKTENKAVK